MDCVYTDNRRGFIQAILLDGYSNASKSHKNHLIATDRTVRELGFRPFRVRANWLPPFLTPSNPIARFQVLNVSTSKSCVLCHRYNKRSSGNEESTVPCVTVSVVVNALGQ